MFTVCIAVFGCSIAAPVSIHDSLQRLQQEVEQLKQRNEETNAVILKLKQTYDEKIRRYDKKIASLEQQTKSGRNLSPLLGIMCFFFIFVNDQYSRLSEEIRSTYKI